MSKPAASTKPSIRGLRAFCIAARHESFRAAADELHITASAVSHQMKKLEEMLGEQLFDRGTRDLKLSKTGTLLYEEL
ncbi:MAG TPA: LysR family transcriptional regulator, partial [Thioalkalivibrio sp.]|nr:LysR family transcriptional regulator [Thioalkalivibrio sp.]